VEYYKLAADRGYAPAQYNYGLCLERGDGVERDLLDAANYFRMAMTQKYGRARESFLRCGRKKFWGKKWSLKNTD
jgi:TPR repeat protein